MRFVKFSSCVGLRHFFSLGTNKIERGLAKVREGHYSLVKMTSVGLSTWLLGIGGYAGLFGSLALFYLYPAFPRKYVPVLCVVPIASAAALYTFFQILYLTLEFVVLVLQSMLNEHITVVLISTTFIGGQVLLIGYVVYKNNYLNRIVLNHAVDEETEGEDEGEDEGEYEGEDEELQPEDVDSGADADNEDGVNLSAVPKCNGCDDECTKCMPPLVSTSAATGLSGEVIADVVCENGVCRINNVTTTSQAWKDMLAEEGVKID